MNRHESRDARQDIRTEESLADCLSRGHVLKREGRIEEAFQAFNRAVELDVDSAEA
jgi:predicted RNA polymerase sigma factor